MSRSIEDSGHITPIDRDYGTCDSTYSELRIDPGKLTAGEITGILQLEPTSTEEKGAIVENSRGRVREVMYAGWFLSTEGVVASKDVREHLDWLIAKLIDVKKPLRLLSASTDNKMTLSCTWWSKAGHGGPVLFPKQMAALSELNLELSFDIYFVDDD